MLEFIEHCHVNFICYNQPVVKNDLLHFVDEKNEPQKGWTHFSKLSRRLEVDLGLNSNVRVLSITILPSATSAPAELGRKGRCLFSERLPLS